MSNEEQALIIIKAFLDGKTIQMYSDSADWYDIENTTLKDIQEEPSEFRIKPESETRPFKNINELIDCFCEKENEDIGSHILYSNYVRPYIWIENRFTEEVELITTYDYANSFHSDDRVETSTRVLTMEDLYREYKFLNDDICGVKK